MLLFLLVLIEAHMEGFWIDQDSVLQNGLAFPEKGNSQYPAAVSPQTVQYSTVQYSTVQYSTVQYSVADIHLYLGV